MVAQWQQSQPWQLGAMNQTAQWQPAGSAVAPTLWQQATAQQAAPQPWAPPGGQAAPTWANPATEAQKDPTLPPWVNPGESMGGGQFNYQQAPAPQAPAPPVTTTAPAGLPDTLTGTKNANAATVAALGTATAQQTGATTAFNPNRTRTSGAQTRQEAGWGNDGAFDPDYQFINGRLHGRNSTHPEDIQLTAMRWALGNMQKGMSQEQAYNAALAQVIGIVNQTGAADSAFTLFKYTPELGAMLAQMGAKGYFDRNAWDEAWKDPAMAGFLNTLQGAGRGFVQYDGRGGTWDTTGKGQIAGDGRTFGSTLGPTTNGEPQPVQNTPPQVDPVTGKPKTDPAAVVAPETTPATTPQGGTLKNFGKLQTNDMAALLQAAANDPDRAAQILRMAQGQTGRPLGRMADFRDSLYGRAFQTALSLAGTDGQGDLQGMAGDFLSKGVQGNDLIGHTGNLARTAMGQDFAGIDSATMEKIARAALAMQGLNMGSLGGAVQQGRLDDLVYSDWERNLTDSGNDQRNWADLLKGSRFQQSMQNYGRR